MRSDGHSFSSRIALQDDLLYSGYSRSVFCHDDGHAKGHQETHSCQIKYKATALSSFCTPIDVLWLSQTVQFGQQSATLRLWRRRSMRGGEAMCMLLPIPLSLYSYELKLLLTYCLFELWPRRLIWEKRFEETEDTIDLFYAWKIWKSDPVWRWECYRESGESTDYAGNHHVILTGTRYHVAVNCSLTNFAPNFGTEGRVSYLIGTTKYTGRISTSWHS